MRAVRRKIDMMPECPVCGFPMREVLPGALLRCPACLTYLRVRKAEGAEAEAAEYSTCKLCGKPLRYVVEMERGVCVECMFRAMGVNPVTGLNAEVRVRGVR